MTWYCSSPCSASVYVHCRAELPASELRDITYIDFLLVFGLSSVHLGLVAQVELQLVQIFLILHDVMVCCRLGDSCQHSGRRGRDGQGRREPHIGGRRACSILESRRENEEFYDGNEIIDADKDEQLAAVMSVDWVTIADTRGVDFAAMNVMRR